MSEAYLQSPVLTVYQPAPRQSWHHSKGFSLEDLPERYKPYVSVKPRGQISRRTDFDPYKVEYLGTSSTPRSWRKHPHAAMPSPGKDGPGDQPPNPGSQTQQQAASQNGHKAASDPKPAPSAATQNGPTPAKTEDKAGTQNQRSPAGEDRHPSNRTNERFTPERKAEPRAGNRAGSPPRYGEAGGRKPGLMAIRNAQHPRGGLVTPRYGGTTPRPIESSAGNRTQNLRLAYDYQGRRITEEPLEEEADATPRHKPNVGREKIETQLRSNRVPETKVRRLAARISYLNDDDTTQETQAERLERILRHTVHNGLDPIVHGASRKTNLDYFNHDPVGLARKINEMSHDIQEEMLVCCDLVGVKEADQEAGKPLGALLRDGIREQQTEVEIMQERLDKVERERASIEKAGSHRANEVEVLKEQNFQQEKEIKKLKEDYMTLVAEIERSREDEDKLRKQVVELERTNARLKQKAFSLEERTVNLEPELEKLHDENARLYADNLQLVNETRRLQGPDMHLFHQMKAMELEVRELKTQCRRTEGEKGQLRGALTKLEANYELLQKEKRSLIQERNSLLKENQRIKSENRRLVLEK